MKGTVKWFNVRKEYGFIHGEDGQDYFVHKSALKPRTFLRENDEVSFEPAETDKGKQAQNVELVQKGSEKNTETTEEEDFQEDSEDF